MPVLQETQPFSVGVAPDLVKEIDSIGVCNDPLLQPTDLLGVALVPVIIILYFIFYTPPS